ncbi:MAG: FkbM family methyltransferase [Flaviramulus sp.]|nr:FkbM family methyltransferase [Flaviramulus sp.]NNC50944.1 FkbM family methyltransferase [Flaviramulus sp.]
MKKLLFQLVNKLGYRIVNKKNERENLALPLKKYDVKQHFEMLFRSKYYIHNLEDKFEKLTIKDHKEGILVQFLNLNIYVESEEEFHILNEVFVRRDYDFISNDQSILIDIGANIGITSLFFSRFDFIEKIYAFEPVKDTFDQAKYNFSLNKSGQKVVCLKNIGLGFNSRKEIFLYDKKWKGNTGLRGIASPSYANNSNTSEREVQIVDASIEINEILKDNLGKKVVIKMDCEGGEYEILENLYKTGTINNIDILLLEWHDKGSQIIEEIMINSGFDYFSKSFDNFSGMIYAFKKK